MNNIKVYVVGPSIGYARWMPCISLVSDIKEANIVWFTGGADINPKLYNEPQHDSTFFFDTRDNFEVTCYKQMSRNQLAIGTCRGAQLFCALNGGKLVQDVSHHCQTHAIKKVADVDGVELPDKCTVTSLHHQMMYPYDLQESDYKVLYVSEPRRSQYYRGTGFDEQKIKEKGEPELVLFDNGKLPVSLGIQGHPEMMYNKEVFVQALIKLTNTLLKKVNPEKFN